MSSILYEYMDIELYNTLSGRKEKFIPLKKTIFGRPRIGMYHCGPTVYWNQTIGNMRAMVMADIIRRTFLYNGARVNFVRNYTDVGHLTGDNLGDADTGEDRMEKAAKREHLSPDAIADKYIKNFERDVLSLNVISPTHSPRATHHIGDMIKMVQILVNKGFAYTTKQAVYFDVSKFTDYTKLSKQNLEKQEAGEGHGSVGDPNKRNSRDFALWFFKTGVHSNALQTWKSPFESSTVEDGRGFPGWHIECSAMSKYYLGKTFDIHMGGIEHVPIHHTNEIAQSESANGVEYVNYWLHNEHLLVDGRKMGKSEGNAYIVKDITDRDISALALRYFFLQAHYRSRQNFTWESLKASETALTRLRESLGNINNNGKVNSEYKNRFQKLVNDDFNVTAGLALVWDILKDTSLSDSVRKATILDFDKVLGLKLDEPKKKTEIPEEILKLVDQRRLARESKDFKKSDELRLEIEKMGYIVKDSPSGQKVDKK
jgi:cysteinyl-tRNA synthetase